MKEITAAWIQTNKEAYRTDEKNSLYEKEYRKKYISDIAFNEEKAKLQKFEFSIDISTMEAVSQECAGRCWIVAGLNLFGINWRKQTVFWKKRFNTEMSRMIKEKYIHGFNIQLLMEDSGRILKSL